jgi:molybdopterin synthase sulfur carrier subunit
MQIQLLFFAGLRETLGVASETLDVPGGVSTIAALRAFLAARGEPWTVLVSGKNLRSAVNQSMAKDDTAFHAGDEIAFFPPVTGG